MLVYYLRYGSSQFATLDSIAMMTSVITLLLNIYLKYSYEDAACTVHATPTVWPKRALVLVSTFLGGKLSPRTTSLVNWAP